MNTNIDFSKGTAATIAEIRKLKSSLATASVQADDILDGTLPEEKATKYLAEVRARQEILRSRILKTLDVLRGAIRADAIAAHAAAEAELGQRNKELGAVRETWRLQLLKDYPKDVARQHFTAGSALVPTVVKEARDAMNAAEARMTEIWQLRCRIDPAAKVIAKDDEWRYPDYHAEDFEKNLLALCGDLAAAV